MIIVLFIFRQGWQRIYSLALFVEHMLLGVGELQLKLRPLVLEHTRRLAQVSPLTLLPQAENKLLKEIKALVNRKTVVLAEFFSLCFSYLAVADSRWSIHRRTT